MRSYAILASVLILLVGAGAACAFGGVEWVEAEEPAGVDDTLDPGRPRFDEDSELELASTPAFCDAHAGLTASLQAAWRVDVEHPGELRAALADLEWELAAIEPLVPNAGVQNQMDELGGLYRPLIEALRSAEWDAAAVPDSPAAPLGLLAFPLPADVELLIDEIEQYGAYHCGHGVVAGSTGIDDVEDQSMDGGFEAPAWAALPDGGTVVGPDFRGWTEWPFEQLDDRARAELRVSRFETDQRLVFLNIMSCVPRSDITVAYGWGLLDTAGELLNPGYELLSVDWLEAPYRHPDEASCGEGWVGVLIDQRAEPASVIWTDPWNGLEERWPIGAPINPANIEPVSDALSTVHFGADAEASSGSHWAVLDLVPVDTAEAETPPPSGTRWWVAEARYCAPPGDDRIHDGLQLGIDGWYVFNSAGREIALDQAHPVQATIGAGECGFIWEAFAIPLELEPTDVRLSSAEGRTIWRP